MKRFISLLLAVVMLLSLTACGGAPEEPGNDVYKADIQEYITDILDESAQISIFEKKSSNIDGDTLTVVCIAMYSGDAGENKGEFTLTYTKDGKSWSLDKCRVNLGEENDDTQTPDGTEGTDAPTTGATTPPATSGPSEISDNWKDFTFSLGGVVYKLPTHYQNFAAQGWKIDGTRSDMAEDDMVPGYTRAYVYLSNGAVYFSAEIINMSGNARAVKDCDIGGITIQANDNLDLKLSGGIGCLSKVEEIQTAYGTPSNINTSTDYSSLKYEVDSYVSMSFYVYTSNTTYNEITLRNFVATDRDATTAKEERPEYLDTYVAPTELGDDIKATRFMLDGVIYQLPCPLDAFTDNGWTVKNDSIGTLGAWNDESGVTIAKGDYRVYLTMINLSDFETYTKNCAVSAVSIEGNYFKGAPKDIAQMPGGTTLWSTVEDVQDMYKDFSPYDGTYSTSFTYEDKDYTMKVKYSFWKEDKYGSFEIKNENWDY